MRNLDNKHYMISFKWESFVIRFFTKDVLIENRQDTILFDAYN